MTLGARPLAVVRMVTSGALALAAAGVLVGAVAALIAARLLSAIASDLLFNVRPGDPVTFLVVATTLTVTAVVAAAVPARRAARVDPMVALRTE
jgi:putative ABC transport system permease protein